MIQIIQNAVVQIRNLIFREWFGLICNSVQNLFLIQKFWTAHLKLNLTGHICENSIFIGGLQK